MATCSEEIPLIVILLGPPGAGKGTHAFPLSQFLHIPHISTGELFREHIREETFLGKIAKKFMDQGHLVPDELVLQMLFLRVSKKDCEGGFILDGFPRTLAQGEALHAKFHTTHRMIALNFDIADSHLLERILGRIVCKSCGASFHTKNTPPKVAHSCDLCQGTLYHRDDDREDLLRNRLEVYRRQTEPLIGFYREKKILQDIEAGQSCRAVFEEILQALSKESVAKL